MVLAFKYGLMVLNIRVTGKIIEPMDAEFFGMLMEINLKVIL